MKEISVNFAEYEKLTKEQKSELAKKEQEESAEKRRLWLAEEAQAEADGTIRRSPPYCPQLARDICIVPD